MSNQTAIAIPLATQNNCFLSKVKWGIYGYLNQENLYKPSFKKPAIYSNHERIVNIGIQTSTIYGSVGTPTPVPPGVSCIQWYCPGQFTSSFAVSREAPDDIYLRYLGCSWRMGKHV